MHDSLNHKQMLENPHIQEKKKFCKNVSNLDHLLITTKVYSNSYNKIVHSDGILYDLLNHIQIL